MTAPPTCIICQEPAAKLVVYINRHTRKEYEALAKCHEHVQQEIVLASSGLSMVDIDIRELV